MEVLRFEEYNEVINEAEISSGKPAIEIDLDDKNVKIKEEVKYNFLGIEFTAHYSIQGDQNEPYKAIIRRPGSDNGTETYWGTVITAESMKELQNEIRVSIKFYIKDNPVIEGFSMFDLYENNNLDQPNENI